MSQFQQRTDKQEFHVKKFCTDTDKDRTTKAEQQAHFNMIHHKGNTNCQFVSPPTSMNPFVQDNSHFGVDYRPFGDTGPFTSQSAMNSPMNFISVGEYNGMKKEHENLQSQFINLQSTFDQFKKSASSEIDGVKKENYRLKLQIEQLQKDNHNNGTPSNHISLPESPGLMPAAENSSVVERLVSLERELKDMKCRLGNPPPCPPPPVLDYFTKLLSHYSSTSLFPPKPHMYGSHIQSGADIIAQGPSSIGNTPTKDRKHMLPIDPDGNERNSPPSKLPKKRNMSGDYIKQDTSRCSIDSVNQESSDTDTNNKELGVPQLPPPIVTVESHVQKTDVPTVHSEGIWGETEVVTPCLPAPEDSPYTPKVQLLPKFNIWVNRNKLTHILQEAASQPTENAPLFVLRRLIPMIFSLDEMASSRGQGLTMKTKGKHDMHASKNPLDPVKIAACKDFMKMYCSQNELVEPSSVAVNSQFTHCITYSRNKIKRMSGKSTGSSKSNKTTQDNSENPPAKEYPSESVDNFSSPVTDNSRQPLVQNDSSFEGQLPDDILNDN